jgi:hypothetical protein
MIWSDNPIYVKLNGLFMFVQAGVAYDRILQ